MILRTLGIVLLALLTWNGSAVAQTWHALHNPAPANVGAMLLLTDGRVLVHSEQANLRNWYTLTPDSNGSYINGTWRQVAPLPTGYGPLFFASAVLPDGRVIIEGGEFNNGTTTPVQTNKGAIYNPKTNKWASVSPPSGWTKIGDASSVVLSNKTYMLASCCDTPPQAALFNASTLSWTDTGSGKFDVYAEEGWTLLPNGKVLTVDAYGLKYGTGTGTNSEIYNPSTGTWSSARSTIVQLWDSAGVCGGSSKASHEVGPAVLRPDGTVFATGANSCGAGHTAIYHTGTGTWTAGPDFPGNLDIADGPAALERNGKVLMMAGPGVFNTGAVFFEWNGSTLTEIVGPPNAPFDSSDEGHFLDLPTGQLLFTDFSTDVEVFTPAGTYNSSWQPTITSVPTTLVRGNTYLISGTQFNGLSQGAAYGDNFQDATNYPLVRIRNNATGHVFYARTHGHSTMAVATKTAIVSTHFDVPTGMETGTSSLVVVANGIPSAPVTVTVG